MQPLSFVRDLTVTLSQFAHCGHRLNVTCVYSSQPPTERSEALRSRASNPIKRYPQIDLHRNAHNSCTPPTAPSNVVLSKPGSVSTGEGLFPVLKIRQLFDDFLSAQLRDAFTALQPELIRTCNLYLETMNASLPILIEAQFRKCVTDLDQVPEIKVRVLLLSIYLVTKIPTQEPEEVTDLEALYSVLKPFYLDLTATRRPSLHIIQAGMLIAVYEQGQAKDETAYLTIGLCARMGHAMGLHRSLHEDMPSDLDSRDTIETHKHVWWSLIILER